MSDIYDKIMTELKSKYIEKGGVSLSVGEHSQNNNFQTNDQPSAHSINSSEPKTMLDINHNELIDLIIDVEHVVKKPSIGYIKTHLDLMKGAWNEFRKAYLEAQLKAEREMNINFNEVQQLHI